MREICWHIFRHSAQKFLDIRQYACGISVQSDEKSGFASFAQALCGVALVSFPAEDGHIESVLVGVQEVKVSFQDWRGRQLVILFHDVEEVHGIDSREQCILYQDIGEFIICKLDKEFNEYRFVGAWDKNAFLKIKLPNR